MYIWCLPPTGSTRSARACKCRGRQKAKQNDAASSSIEAVKFFGIEQEVYKYFSASTYRYSILKKPCNFFESKTTNVSDTRWESLFYAVTALRYHFREIYDALYQLTTDSRADAKGKNAALGLARKLKSLKFVCCLVVWQSILFRINLIIELTQENKCIPQSRLNLLTK